MAKIFDRQLEDLRIKRVNEDRWFMLHQKALLWLANTHEGRDFLCIDQRFPIIHEIAKNYIKHVEISEKKAIITAEFHVGAKYANIIRYRWEEWQDYLADYRVGLYLRTIPRQFVPKETMGYSILYATLTQYPDPGDPGTTTVDGRAYRSLAASEIFSTRRNGVGDAKDVTNVTLIQDVVTDTVTDKWSEISRSFINFDTSSIGNSGTITAVTIDIWVKAKFDQFVSGGSIATCNNASASATTIANSDYENGAGTTRWSSDFTIAGLTVDAYNTITGNASFQSGINKTGVTKMGFRNVEDIDNAPPAWESGKGRQINIASADTAGTSNDPKLTVTYTVAITAAGTLLMMGI